jgi:hypothetical protein
VLTKGVVKLDADVPVLAAKAAAATAAAFANAARGCCC